MNLQPVTLHQTLHGYRRGHELLSASTDLTASDLDRLAQLSDLSGYPVSPSFPPYLTCYPLPSQKFYAFACTWSDEDAPRDGCVLTHTLLVPMEAWANSHIDAQELKDFFRRPDRTKFDAFRQEIETQQRSELRSREWGPDIRRIVANYFVNGQPLVVLAIDSDMGGEVLPAFLNLLWPSLRVRFSACTYALQPRQIGSTQFDLLFAPVEALSKYSRVPESQLVRNVSEPFSTDDARVAKLIQLVNLERTGEQILAEFFGRELWDELPADPTALHRLVIFDDLNRRSELTPSSSIAALDVLGGIFPSPNTAVKAKEKALVIAIERAMSQPLATKLEFLASVALRCSKSSFGKLRKLRRDLVKEITRISIEAPESALEAMSRSKGRNAPLFSGIGKGVPSWDIHDHELLGDFGAHFPSQIESLLRYSPEVAPAHLMAMDESERGFERGVANILNWYRHSRLYVQRLIAKNIVETVLFSRNNELVEIAVEHAGVKQLDSIFTALLMDPHRVLKSESVLETVVHKFPNESRDSILRTGIQTDLAANLFVSTLSAGLDGFKIIESLNGQRGYAKATAAFVRHSPNVDAASLEIESRSGAWLGLWLRSDSAPSKCMLASARILLTRFENQEISLLLDPKKDYFFESDPSFEMLLGNSILRSMVHAYLSDSMSQDTLLCWLRNVLISRRVQSSEDFGLQVAQLKNHHSYSNGTVNWQYVRLAAEETLASHRKLEPLCAWLFATYMSTWNQKMTNEWRLILEFVQKTARQISRLEVDSLNTALDHPELPLIEVIEQTFARVYRATAPKPSQTIFDLMWTGGFDSGRTLRTKLLAAFRQSNWPVAKLGEIALAAEIAEQVFRELRALDHRYFNLLANELRISWKAQPHFHKILKTLDQLSR